MTKTTTDAASTFDKKIITKVMAVLLVLTLPLLFQRYAKPLLPMIFVVPGICFLAWGIWIICLSRASKNWLVTKGTILENKIGEISRPGSPGRITYSFPKIAYRYRVDGIEYLSRRMVLFPSDLEYPGQAEEPSRFCARYPIDSEVDVHYSQRSPGNGVLVVGALVRSKQHSIVFLITGVFLLSIGLFLFYANVVMQ